MKYLILFIITALATGCSSNDDSNGNPSFNSFNDFNRVIVRYQFYLNPDVNANCNNDSELRVNFATGVFKTDGLSSGEQYPLQHGYLESVLTDAETNPTPGISLIENGISENFEKVILVNKVGVRLENNTHDFSYFESLNDTIQIDIDVKGLSFWDTSSNYKYERKQNNEFLECRSGIITGTEYADYYIDEDFTLQDYLDNFILEGNYKIVDNNLILLEPHAL